MTTDPKCDFCSQRPVRWAYPARPVHLLALMAQGKDVTAFGWNTDDPWAACDPCHDMIERGDRTALRERSVKMFPGPRGPMTEAQLRHTIKQAHDGFFSAVTGDPIPYEAEEANDG